MRTHGTVFIVLLLALNTLTETIAFGCGLKDFLHSELRAAIVEESKQKIKTYDKTNGHRIWVDAKTMAARLDKSGGESLAHWMLQELNAGGLRLDPNLIQLLTLIQTPTAVQILAESAVMEKWGLFSGSPLTLSALRSVGDPAVIPTLRNYFKYIENTVERRAMISLLSYLGENEAFREISSELESVSNQVAEQRAKVELSTVINMRNAIEDLGQSKRPESVRVIGLAVTKYFQAGMPHANRFWSPNYDATHIDTSSGFPKPLSVLYTTVDAYARLALETGDSAALSQSLSWIKDHRNYDSATFKYIIGKYAISSFSLPQVLGKASQRWSEAFQSELFQRLSDPSAPYHQEAWDLAQESPLAHESIEQVLLKSPDESTRLRALKVLVSDPKYPALNLYRALLHDSSPQVRLEIVKQLKDTPADSMRFMTAGSTQQFFLEYTSLDALRSESDSEVAKVWSETVAQYIRGLSQNSAAYPRVLAMAESGVLNPANVSHKGLQKAVTEYLLGSSRLTVPVLLQRAQFKRVNDVEETLFGRALTENQEQALRTCDLIYAGCLDAKLGIKQPDTLGETVKKRALLVQGTLLHAGFTDQELYVYKHLLYEGLLYPFHRPKKPVTLEVLKGLF